MKPPTEYELELLKEIERMKAELTKAQNKAHFATQERDEAMAKCAEEKKYAEDLAKDLCEMEDALGFKQDQTDSNGAFVPTKVPWLERVRDLISAESELVDVKDSVRRIVAERDAAISNFGRMKEALFCAKYAFDNCGVFLWKPDVGCLRWNFAEISAAVDAALSADCGKGWVRAEELKPTLAFLRGLLDVTREFLDNDKGHYTELTLAELARLQKLVEGEQ